MMVMILYKESFPHLSYNSSSSVKGQSQKFLIPLKQPGRKADSHGSYSYTKQVKCALP